MNNKLTMTGVAAVIALLVGFAAGYYVPHTAAATSGRGQFAGGAGTFGGRAGGTALFGGATVGTVVQVGNGSFTVQLPSSTSTTATTGTKLVLVSSATEVDELQSVPTSTIQVGQTVTVNGSSNSDGSITASNVMIRPAATRGRGAGSQTSGQ